MPKKQSSIALFRKQLKLGTTGPDEPEKKVKKKSPFFSLIDHMGGDKCPWDLLTDEERNSMSQYMVLKWLSTYEEYLPMFNFVSQVELSDKDFYTLMCEILRRQRHYFTSKIYKKIEEDDFALKCIEHEYFYTRRKAREYLTDIDPDELKYITDRWGEIVKEELAKK